MFFLFYAGLVFISCNDNNPYREPKRGGREFISGSGFQEIVPLADGERFLTVFRQGSYQHLWLGRLFGSDKRLVSWRQLTFGARYDFDVVYNEQTDTFVFCSIYGGYDFKAKQTHIWRIHADGTDLTQLTSGNDICQYPSIDHKGEKIAFVSYCTHIECDLWLYDISSSQQIRLTKDPETHDTFPLFSDDGRLFFLRGYRFGHSSPIASSDWKDYSVMQWDFDENKPIPLFDTKRDRRVADFLMTADARIMAIVDIQGARFNDNNVIFYRFFGKGKSEIVDFQTETYFRRLKNGVKLRQSVSDLSFSSGPYKALFITCEDLLNVYDDNLHILDLTSMQTHQITYLNKNILRHQHYELQKTAFFEKAQKFMFLVRLNGADGTWNLWECDEHGENAILLSTDPMMETSIIW